MDMLKRTWADMGRALGAGDSHIDPVKLNSLKTSLDRLRERYRRFWIIAICMVLPSYTLMWKNKVINPDFALPLALSYATYFLLCFCMDLQLWRGIGKIHPLTMTISKVASMALHCRKRHLIYMGCLLPLAIALLGFTAYAYHSEVYFICGMLTGAIFGAIMGIMQFRRFMADYRHLAG